MKTLLKAIHRRHAPKGRIIATLLLISSGLPAPRAHAADSPNCENVEAAFRVLQKYQPALSWHDYLTYDTIISDAKNGKSGETQQRALKFLTKQLPVLPRAYTESRATAKKIAMRELRILFTIISSAYLNYEKSYREFLAPKPESNPANPEYTFQTSEKVLRKALDDVGEAWEGLFYPLSATGSQIGHSCPLTFEKLFKQKPDPKDWHKLNFPPDYDPDVPRNK